MLIVCKVCTKIVQVLRYPGHMQKHKEKSQLKGKIKIFVEERDAQNTKILKLIEKEVDKQDK